MPLPASQSFSALAASSAADPSRLWPQPWPLPLRSSGRGSATPASWLSPGSASNSPSKAITGPPWPASPMTAVGMSARLRVMRNPSRSSSLMCSATERCSAYCNSGMPQMRSLSASNASFLASTRRQIGSLLSMVSSPCRSCALRCHDPTCVVICRGGFETRPYKGGLPLATCLDRPDVDQRVTADNVIGVVEVHRRVAMRRCAFDAAAEPGPFRALRQDELAVLVTEELVAAAPRRALGHLRDGAVGGERLEAGVGGDVAARVRAHHRGRDEQRGLERRRVGAVAQRPLVIDVHEDV